MKAEALPTVDGRRARRDRNRERVVDALLDLYREGELRPSVAEVADRSGVSHRSVFRYFEDLGELHRVAVERQFSAVRKFLLISGIGRGPLPQRIDKLVEGRLNLYDASAPVARVARMLAPVEPVLAEHLRGMASASVEQITQHFAPELGSLDEKEAAATAEAAALAVSMEAMEVLRHTRGLSRDRAAATIRATLHGLLTEGSAG
jgi:TetR/AcrR family transcriptional regulator, regulator of autoinduction and epiphytic fitness